ncbi:MAG: PEP-CTERM sorting domain-containing protein [Bryobacteraceae bacterium]
MRKLLLVSILAVATSFAGIIKIDGFADGQGPITAIGTNGPMVISDSDVLPPMSVSRTLEFAPPAVDTPPVSRSMIVDSGVLDINHGTGENTTARVIYALPQIVLPPAAIASTVELFLEIVQSDANPTNVQVLLNGGSLGSFAIPGNTMNQQVVFAVPSLVFGNPGTNSLVLEVTGANSYDITLDSFGVQWSTTPEPGTMVLVGLAISGLGLLRRRRPVA